MLYCRELEMVYMMNTKRTFTLYAVASLLMIVDFSLLTEYGIEYGIQMFMMLFLPVLIVSAVLVLICVLLWKKPVQLSKDDIFFFVAYHAVIPYSIFSVAMLIIMLFRMLF